MRMFGWAGGCSSLGSRVAPILALGSICLLGAGAVRAQVTFTSTSYSFQEFQGSASVTIRRSGDTSAQLVVGYSLIADTARAGRDYEAVGSQVTIRAGSATATFPFANILGDHSSTEDRSFSIRLTTVAPQQTARVTIQNIDQPAGSIFGFAAAASQVDEGGTARVDVRRSGTGAASVDYTVTAGTAHADDYSGPMSGRLDFGPTDTTKSISIPIASDHRREDSETFQISLSNPLPSGSSLGSQATHVVTILDDDNPSGISADPNNLKSISTGLDATFAVFVKDQLGQVIAAVPILWEVAPPPGVRVEYRDGDVSRRTQTDAQGRATLKVRFGGQGTGDARLTAQIPNSSVGAFSFTVAVLQPFDGGSGGGEPTTGGGALETSCADPQNQGKPECQYVGSLTSEPQREQFNQAVTPDEVASQATVSVESVSIQLRNLSSHLAALRGGATRSASEQVAIMIDGRPFDLDWLRSAYVERTAVDVGGRAEASLDEALSGAGASADGEATSAPAAAARPRRVGLFVSGRATFGKQEGGAGAAETGFDFTTGGLTAGVDYFASKRITVGGALSYVDTSADLDGRAGSLDSTGTSANAFLVVQPTPSTWIQLATSYGQLDFETKRRLILPAVTVNGASIQLPELVAVGDPKGDSVGAQIQTGLDLHSGALGIGLFAGASYLNAKIDGYTERGAQVTSGEFSGANFNLVLDGQELKSVLGEAGGELTYPFSMSKGVLLPLLRLSYRHEFEDSTRFVRGHFVTDGAAINPFAVPTNAPDVDYVTWGVGLTYQMIGRSLVFDYEQDALRDRLEIRTVSLRFRQEL